MKASNKQDPDSTYSFKHHSHYSEKIYPKAFTSSSTLWAFTIVELLVVIVVIGILAAITIVSYTEISKKATIASLLSDLSNSSKKFKMYQIEHGLFPQQMTDSGGNGDYCPTPADAKYCIKVSPNTILRYTNLLPSTFHLTGEKNSIGYSINNDSKPTVADVTSCPSGFIPIPGSGTYGTSDFCVMKYEAKQVGTSSTPISQASGTPWVNIDQTTATSNSMNVANCTGCHLITEFEWLTIAQNVLTVPSNWNTGIVGSGYIYSGHSDGVPDNALGADSNDSNGYYGTGNVAFSNQRRTLTLSNNQIIWDLAANIYEWTSGTSTTGQPGVAGAGYIRSQWNEITIPGTLSPNPSPASTGIVGASGWNQTNGIGKVYSYADETILRGSIRSGGFNDGGTGVFALNKSGGLSYFDDAIGFRVSR